MSQQKTAQRRPVGGAPTQYPELATPSRGFSQAPAHQPQAKLTVNDPGDQFEQEADAVAGQVMRMPEATAPTLVQRESDGTATSEADVSGVVDQGLSGGGQSLDPETRSFMEPRFGHDFSQVKIHTDGAASQSAQSVAARAYTVGSDIAFRSGEYSPGSSGGRELLAHELTHVVQQGQAAPTAQVQRDDDDGGSYLDQASNWASGKVDEAKDGITGAAQDAVNFGAGRVDAAVTTASNEANAAVNWGTEEYKQASDGVTGAVDSAEQWGQGRVDTAVNGVTNAYGQATAWGENKYNQADVGVSEFKDQAENWNSVDDAASGIAGGVQDAANWGMGAANEAKDGITRAGSDYMGFIGDTRDQAIGGAMGAVGDAANWGMGAANEAKDGITDASADWQQWRAGNRNGAMGLASDELKDAQVWAGHTIGEAGTGLGNAVAENNRPWIDPSQLIE